MSNNIERICILVHHCHELLLKLRHTKKADNELSRIGISMQQGIILKILLMEDGLTQKELTEKLQITSSSCGALLMKLEQNGYLKRQVHAKDKRTFKVSLTDSGRAVGAQYKEMSIATLEKWCSNMTESEKEQLFTLLSKLYEGLYAQQKT